MHTTVRSLLEAVLNSFYGLVKNSTVWMFVQWVTVSV